MRGVSGSAISPESWQVKDQPYRFLPYRAFTKNMLGIVRCNITAETCIHRREATMVQETISWQRPMNEHPMQVHVLP